MSGVNQWSTLCSGDILQSLWTARRSGCGSIGRGSWVGGPLDGTYDDFLGNYEFRFLTDLFRSMKARESVRFHIFGTWTIGDGKVESGEKERPLCLARVKSLGFSQILQVFMVSEDNEWMLCTLQPMPPLLQG